MEAILPWSVPGLTSPALVLFVGFVHSCRLSDAATCQASPARWEQPVRSIRHFSRAWTGRRLRPQLMGMFGEGLWKWLVRMLLSFVHYPSGLGNFLGNQRAAILSLFFQLIILFSHKYLFYVSGGQFCFPKFAIHVRCFSLHRDILSLILLG